MWLAAFGAWGSLCRATDTMLAGADTFKRLADVLNKSGERAQANGLKLCYHNHAFEFESFGGKTGFEMLMSATDKKLVSLEMDIFWTTAGGADPIKYLDGNPGRYKLMHVKDMTKQVRFSGDGGNPQQWMELFPYITDVGSGVLDLKTILSHAKKSGLVHFIIENDVIINPKDSLEKGYQYLSSLKLTE